MRVAHHEEAASLEAGDYGLWPCLAYVIINGQPASSDYETLLQVKCCGNWYSSMPILARFLRSCTTQLLAAASALIAGSIAARVLRCQFAERRRRS